MKLHIVEGSPNGRKVEIVIAHLGLQVERVYYDVFGGALRQPDYLSINPNAKIPTLARPSLPGRGAADACRLLGRDLRGISQPRAVRLVAV